MPHSTALRTILVCLSVVFGVSLAAAATRMSAPPNKALVYVIQGETQHFGNLLVYVNGRYVERVRANSYFAFAVEPGTHEISTAGPNRAALPLTVNAGATYYVSQRVKPDGDAEIRLISEADAQPLLGRYYQVRSDVVTVGAPTEARSPSVRAGAGAPTRGHFYIGASLGIARAKDAAPCTQFQSSLIGSYSCMFEDTNAAYGVFGGYRVNRNLALEVGYLDAGKFTASASNASGSGSDRFTASGITADVVATVPVAARVGLLGRAGLFQWKVKDTTDDNGVSDTTSKSGSSAHFGVGIVLEISRNLELRGTFDKFKNVGNEDITGRSDVDLVAGSLVFLF